MALGPTTLLASLRKEAIEFERLIDERLSKQKLYGSKICIDPPKGMNEKHLDVLRDEYIKAGWTKIFWNSSQRDGDSITFSIEPVRRIIPACNDFKPGY